MPTGNTTTAAVSIRSERPIVQKGKANRGAQLKAIESAVYAHIRAVRALGRQTINTSEIAEALGLSVDIVNGAIANLTKKGVKIV